MLIKLIRYDFDFLMYIPKNIEKREQQIKSVGKSL